MGRKLSSSSPDFKAKRLQRIARMVEKRRKQDLLAEAAGAIGHHDVIDDLVDN